MSVTEVIEEIKRLSREEQKQVASFISTLELQNAPGRLAGEVSGDFKRIADEVFGTNDKLFRKLAQ